MTTESKHTPGPWEMSKFEYALPHEIQPQFLIGPEKYHTVAHVRAGCEDDDLPAQTEANARLIAAAPNLLEALEMAVNQITGLAGPQDVPDFCRAALAKAKGEVAP